jgi:transcriptional regulator with XRE-family HTH domain
MAQDDWAAGLVTLIAGEIRRYRGLRGMSAQDLADRCGELGFKVHRSVLANLENGRRESVSVMELLVIAAALQVAPLLLLYPIGTVPLTEYLPRQLAPPLDVARWWTGEAGVDKYGDLVFADDRASVIELFLHHKRLVSELPEGVTEADYRAARARQGLGARRGHQEPAARETMFRIIELRENRAEIRSRGTEPPQLPPGLKWLDEER